MRPERPDARWQLMRVGRTGSAGRSGQRPQPPPPALPVQSGRYCPCVGKFKSKQASSCFFLPNSPGRSPRPSPAIRGATGTAPAGLGTYICPPRHHRCMFGAQDAKPSAKELRRKARTSGKPGRVNPDPVSARSASGACTGKGGCFNVQTNILRQLARNQTRKVKEWCCLCDLPSCEGLGAAR
jgi:hypothetical protein